MKFCQYVTYTAVDFSTDPFFLEWRWFQTEETAQFWTAFLSAHPEKSDEILLAIKIVALSFVDETISFSKQEKESAIKKLTAKVHRNKRRKRSAIYSLSTVVILVTLLFFPFRNRPHLLQTDEKTFVEIPEKEVQLIFSTGNRVTFNEDIQVAYDTTGNIVVQNESGKMLEKHKSDETAVTLNRLIVPKGKRSSLLLADGSRIWINSGTIVEFPSVFSKTDERKIIIDGEIYIEVEKDMQRPFLVATPHFEVAVLGTKFNVSAYSEDAVQHVTVAEGLVSVLSGEEKKNNFVKQNQQLRMMENNTTINNVDVYNYTSWKEGILRFESEPLKNILTRLSRYYDIHLDYESDIEEIRCSGKLFLFDDWQTVFNNITKVSPVEYSVTNNEVVLRYNSKK